LKPAERPIGIFDSGIGGLTVASAIHKAMPDETLIYFGDTAHLPYGEKSPESIRHYSKKITEFLLQKNCKCVVIACNTASSLAYETVLSVAGKEVPVVNVIDPVAHEVVRKTEGKIGIIATKATVRSGMYEKKIKALDPEREVVQLATPLLAPMIEEGFFNNNISRTIIHSYLSRPKIKKIHSLILACTHYPLIKKEIEEYYKGSVHIADSAEIVAEHIRKTLKAKKLLNTGKSGMHHFFVSEYTESFAKSTRYFFKEKIKLEYFPMWDKK
jgi:glutamate racemase